MTAEQAGDQLGGRGSLPGQGDTLACFGQDVGSGGNEKNQARESFLKWRE